MKKETKVEAQMQSLDSHRQRLMDMARAYDERHGVTITDVTPDGYGPGDSPTSYSTDAPHLTTEQSRLHRSINEAQTLLQGRLSAARRAAIQKSLARAQEQLQVATPQSEADRQTLVRLATDAGR